MLQSRGTTTAGSGTCNLQHLPVVTMVRRKRTAGVAGEKAGDPPSGPWLVRAFPIHPREEQLPGSLPAFFLLWGLRRALLPLPSAPQECTCPLPPLRLSLRHLCWLEPQGQGNDEAVFRVPFTTLRSPPFHSMMLGLAAPQCPGTLSSGFGASICSFSRYSAHATWQMLC